MQEMLKQPVEKKEVWLHLTPQQTQQLARELLTAQKVGKQNMETYKDTITNAIPPNVSMKDLINTANTDVKPTVKYKV